MVKGINVIITIFDISRYRLSDHGLTPVLTSSDDTSLERHLERGTKGRGNKVGTHGVWRHKQER